MVSSPAKLSLSHVAWGLSLQSLVYNIYLELYSFRFLQWCNGHYISPVSYKIDLRIYIYSLFCDKRSIYNWMYASPAMLKPAQAMHEKQSHRSACASAQADQWLCCSLSINNTSCTWWIQNLQILTCLCSWADWVEPICESKDRIYRDVAYLVVYENQFFQSEVQFFIFRVKWTR